MRDQYAGDVSDVLKFGLLRALAGGDRQVGVAWYYAPGDDGRPDGRHLEWRDEAGWRELDAGLHAGLAGLPERSVAALERAAIWARPALFHRQPMPSRLGRETWVKGMLASLADADLVFLDPDNGLGDASEKHATLEEVRRLRRPGRAVAFITFPGRSRHDALVRELHSQVRSETGADIVHTLLTNVSVPRGDGSRFVVQRPRWFTVVDADEILVARLQAFAVAIDGIHRVKDRISA